MAEEMKFEIKKIALDKIGLLVVSAILALFTVLYVEKEKEEIAYEHALALKYTDYQLKTYHSANELAYLIFLKLSLFIEVENNKSIVFSEQMKEIVLTKKKVNQKINELESSMIQYSPFLTKYSINELYIPLMMEYYEITKELKNSKGDFKEALKVVKKHIPQLKKFNNDLKDTSKILKKVKPKDTITTVQLISHPLFRNNRN